MKKVAVYLIVISILFTSVFGINSLAYNNDGTEHFLNTCAAEYYSVLRNRFAKNFDNSCGYVAVAMLLSFYDSY